MGDTGDIQNPTSHGPGKPGLGGPALSRGVGLEDLQRHLPSSSVLWRMKNESNLSYKANFDGLEGFFGVDEGHTEVQNEFFGTEYVDNNI